MDSHLVWKSWHEVSVLLRDAELVMTAFVLEEGPARRRSLDSSLLASGFGSSHGPFPWDRRYPWKFPEALPYFLPKHAGV